MRPELGPHSSGIYMVVSPNIGTNILQWVMTVREIWLEGLRNPQKSFF
jgi:hypothetical protein